jgi:hypothetical protein
LHAKTKLNQDHQNTKTGHFSPKTRKSHSQNIDLLLFGTLNCPCLLTETGTIGRAFVHSPPHKPRQQQSRRFGRRTARHWQPDATLNEIRIIHHQTRYSGTESEGTAARYFSSALRTRSSCSVSTSNRHPARLSHLSPAGGARGQKGWKQSLDTS